MDNKEKGEQLYHWKELIKQTEEMVKDWKDSEEESPYYNQIHKSWENFIEKQKEEIHYHMKRIGSTDEQDNKF